MRNDRDALVVVLEFSQGAIEPGCFLVERRHVAEKRSLESVKDEVVVAIEAGIFQQDFRCAPGVDVITNEAVDENDDVFGLKDLMPEMQQVALVMRFLAKPARVL